MANRKQKVTKPAAKRAPEAPGQAGKEKSKYAAKLTKSGYLEDIKKSVNAGWSAVRIHKELTMGKRPLRTLQRYAKEFKAGGTVCAHRAPGGGRKLKQPGLAEDVRKSYNPDGRTISRSVSSLARTLNATRDEVRYVCKKKLSLKNVAKMKGCRMSAKNVESRHNFAKIVIKRLASGKRPLKVADIWFTDEKMFTAEPRHQGTRNDRVLIPSDMKKSEVDASVIVRGAPAHSL